MSGILKFAAWPVVAVIALFMFGPSLMNQLDSGNVKKLKIGMLEIDMSEAESLSLSDPVVAAGLAGLSEKSIVSLLFAEPEIGYSQCANDGDSQVLEEEYGVPFRDLESRGFVTSSETSEGGEKCFGIDLTDDGTVARQFLLDLIAAQLGAATAK